MDGLTALTNFTTMLVNRYNKVGGAWYNANFATLGKGIQMWETNNEPKMDGLGNANGSGIGAQVGSFSWMTNTQTVDHAYTQYAAIKAADSSIVVTSPGFTAGTITTTMGVFLPQLGTVNGTKHGSDSCDAIAWHPYRHNQPGTFWGAWLNDIVDGRAGIRTINSWQAAHSYNFPLVISEVGVDTDSTTADVTRWYAQTPSFRYTWMVRWWMICAAFSVKSVFEWKWASDSSNDSVHGCSGWWQGDTNGVCQASKDFVVNVQGKTINSGTYTLNGAVTLNFSDGTSWTV